MGATIYCLCNQKGGCAKTMSSVSLGIGLAREGKKVLLADIDAQGSMTASLGYQHPDRMEITLATVLGAVITDSPLPEGGGAFLRNDRPIKRDLYFYFLLIKSRQLIEKKNYVWLWALFFNWIIWFVDV